MNSTKRVAIIGAGNVAKQHILGWRETKGAEPVVICRQNEDKARRMAQEVQLEGTTDYSSLLHRNDIDIVDIIVPSGLHAELGIKAARAGKHVIVEKPIDVSLEKADDLIKTCRDKGVTLGVISQYRFMDGMLEMYRLLEAEHLGDLIQGDALIKWFRPQSYYDSGEWRGTRELDGGGAFINQAIHFIDLLLSVMGPVKSVYAKTKTLAHDIEVEDIGVALLEFTSGAYGVIEASTAMYPGLPARLDIHGSKGTLSIEGDKMVFLHIRGQDPVTQSDVQSGGASDPTDIDVRPFVRQFTDIIEAISAHRDPIVCGSVARRPLELILAIYQSSKTGGGIHLL